MPRALPGALFNPRPTVATLRNLLVTVLLVACGMGVWFVAPHGGSDSARSSEPTDPVHREAPTLWDLLAKSTSSAKGIRGMETIFVKSFSGITDASLIPHRRLNIRVGRALGRRLSQFAIIRSIRSAGKQLWVMLDRGIICLTLAPSAATSCTELSEAIDHGLAVGVAWSRQPRDDRPGQYEVVGIAADWVKDVLLKAGSVLCHIAPVNNSYSVRALHRVTVVGVYPRALGDGASCEAVAK